MDQSPELAHEVKVDRWLEHSLDHGSSAEIIRLFHDAVEAIWKAAVTTLGTVTLTAIAERVLSKASQQHGFLSAINPRAGTGGWNDQLHQQLAVVPRAQLIEGLRFGLIELLAVIGRLTAEILRDPLHAALDAVTATTPEAKPSRHSTTAPTLSVVPDKVSR